MHVLYVTRRFPPATGGMETQAYDTWRGLQAAGARVTLIAHGSGNRREPGGLPSPVAQVWQAAYEVAQLFWMPLAVVRMWRVIRRDRPDVVLLGDAFMNASGTRLLRLLRMPHATQVMGLDVTFDSNMYRKFVVRHLRSTPMIIPQSAATASAVRAAGVREDRMRILPLSVTAPEEPLPRDSARAELCRRYGIDPEATILLTVGRLVRRKGVAWLVSQVLPEVKGNWVYLVAGEGPANARIRSAIERTGLQHHVKMLGLVPDDVRELVFRGSDLFVQPNIRVYGDMEGFGLVNVEAGVRDTPVLAARLEGIQDAIVDGQTGWLITSEDAPEWRERLTELVADRAGLARSGAEFGERARDTYSPERYNTGLLGLLREVAREGTTAADLAPTADEDDRKP